MLQVTRPLILSGDLLQHQSQACGWLLQNPRAVLADSVGLGKTPTVLAHAAELGEFGELAPAPLCRVLWLTEASLISQTASEIRRFLPGAVVVAQGDGILNSSAKQLSAFAELRQSGIDFLVISHDAAKGESWAGLLDGNRFPLLVVDEASKTRGGGPIAEAVNRLAVRSGRVVAMTATVIENSPMDLWHLLSAIGSPVGITQAQYEEAIEWRERQTQWGQAERYPHCWRPEYLENVRYLVNRFILRRTAEGLGLPLPERVGETALWTPPTAPQRAAYMAADARRGGTTAALRGAILDFSAGSNQIDSLLAQLDSHTDQCVIRTESVRMLDEVARRLKAAGVDHLRIQGATSKPGRQEAAARHRAGDTRALIGTRVLERGLNLQHCRNLYTVGESTWNPAREEQYEGRVRRLGSPHATFEHLTLAADLPLFKAQFGTQIRKSVFATQAGL